MTEPGQCANCGTPLPAGQPAGHHYCASCAAAWSGGDAQRGEGAAAGEDAAPAGGGQCANCQAPLPADQPAGHHYCASCAAAWQRGQAKRQKSAR